MTRADRSDPSVTGHVSVDRSATKVYLVGGGIASMAAAAFTIRDGKTGTLTEARIKLVREVDISGCDSGAVIQMSLRRKTS